MHTIQKFCGLLGLILFATGAHAVSIPLNNISDDDMKKVTGDMTANFHHSSVSGANTLGKLWGFEVGVVGNSTSTPHLNEVANKPPASGDAGKLYNAALLGVVSVPFGLTGEVSVLPRQTMSGISFGTFSLAAKWSLTEVFLSDLPFSLALKGAYSTADVKFSQSISPYGTVDYSYTNKETSGMVLISKNLAILEPYAGIGIVNAKGDLSGNAPVFTGSAQSGSATRSGLTWMVGTEIKLIVVKLGVEYAQILDTSRVGGKVSFYF